MIGKYEAYLGRFFANSVIKTIFRFNKSAF